MKRLQYSFTLLVHTWTCTVVLVLGNIEHGMLYPRESESRELKKLDGLWQFRADLSAGRDAGFREEWYNSPLKQSGPVIPMPVPSSYNDITVDRALQNFVGWVWYEREFFLPSAWNAKRVTLRFDSVHYYAVVWVNGVKVMEHEGGHLPFEAPINKFSDFLSPNRVTVAVNNTLSPTTLPPGFIEYHSEVSGYPPGYFTQEKDFDFFNYAGIHRHVSVYTTPTVYVDDISITSSINGTTGIVHFATKIGGEDDKCQREDSFQPPEGAYCAQIHVAVISSAGKVVAQSTSRDGHIFIDNAELWWPYTMNKENPAYMYTFQVIAQSNSTRDVYRLPFGIRTVKVTKKRLLVNNQPFYCLGVGKHEDSEIRGKGLDYALIARDFNMMKWMGVNCFRTSHYPYAEEIMDQADQQGIVVIDECPGVGIKSKDNFGNQSLAHHLSVMSELVRRDKNRPSVIMWSVANEPATRLSVAKKYFRTVIKHTKQLDPTRPVTFVSNQPYDKDVAAKYVDVLCVNKYYGWYEDTGHPEVIPGRLSTFLQGWYDRYHRPVIMTEYGAGAVEGLHTLPTLTFTEDYQVDLLRTHHSVFDIFRKSFLVGEMVWNFADFMTSQSVKRVVGNRKGLLTRQRQPKESAYLVRQRYLSLVNNSVQPNDVCPPFGWDSQQITRSKIFG